MLECSSGIGISGKRGCRGSEGFGDWSKEKMWPKVTQALLGNWQICIWDVPSSGCWSRAYGTQGLLLRRGGWPENSPGRRGEVRLTASAWCLPEHGKGVSGSETSKSCNLLEPRNHKALTHLRLADVGGEIGYKSREAQKGQHLLIWAMFKATGYIQIWIWHQPAFVLTDFSSQWGNNNIGVNTQGASLAYLCDRGSREIM